MTRILSQQAICPKKNCPQKETPTSTSLEPPGLELSMPTRAKQAISRKNVAKIGTKLFFCGDIETFISTTQYNTADFTILILNKQAIFQNNSQSRTL